MMVAGTSAFAQITTCDSSTHGGKCGDIMLAVPQRGMTAQDRVFTKCAWRLIPFMGLLYLINYVDRTNVGFAALTMNADLDFSPAVYGFGAGIFFLGSALVQLPANLILERIGPRRWVFCILVTWGLLSASTALVETPTGFYTVRFLLGVAESGFFPGMLLYLTYWFPRAYLPQFTATFMVAIPLSFVVGGPLASLIVQLDGVAGLHGWQWLFVLEGLPASLLAFAVLKLLPDGPAHAKWLNDEEKKIIAARIAAEEPPGRGDLLSALHRPTRHNARARKFHIPSQRFWRRIVAAADCAGDGLLQSRDRFRRRVDLCRRRGCDDFLRPFQRVERRTHLARRAALVACRPRRCNRHRGAIRFACAPCTGARICRPQCGARPLFQSSVVVPTRHRGSRRHRPLQHVGESGRVFRPDSRRRSDAR